MHNPAPNTTYRISAKAVVKNADGKVLLLRETEGDWGLPGGGIEHGEAIIDGLKRELAEELGITEVIHVKLAYAHPYFSTRRNAWWMWLIYEVKVTLPAKLGGEFGAGATFKDIAEFKTTTNLAEQRIYSALSMLE